MHTIKNMPQILVMRTLHTEKVHLNVDSPISPKSKSDVWVYCMSYKCHNYAFYCTLILSRIWFFILILAEQVIGEERSRSKKRAKGKGDQRGEIEAKPEEKEEEDEEARR